MGLQTARGESNGLVHQFEEIGVNREMLEKTGVLEAMLNYRKTDGLIPIVAQLGHTTHSCRSSFVAPENVN